MYGWVLRGVSPSEADCIKGAALIQRAGGRTQGALSSKQAWTTAWLSTTYLVAMEFMPNENRIVLRGIGTPEVHESLYSQPADDAGMKLSYRRFMECLRPAAQQAALDHGASPEVAAQTKCSRSARHSKFPNCTQCHDNMKEYIKDASNPLCPPSKVKASKGKMLAHQGKFMACRHTARRLRSESTLPDRQSLYECDDKCGSFWCKCPVVEGGRDSKHTSTRCYEFAVQANVG
jgi:hypothetical protein